MLRLNSSDHNDRFYPAWHSVCFLLVWFFFWQLGPGSAQTVYVPTHHWVYDYLDRLETLGIVDNVLSNTRPMTRLEIAKNIYRILPMRDRLSRADQQQLEFLQVEFREELLRMNASLSEGNTRIGRLARHKWVDPWLPNILYANGRNLLSLSIPPVQIYVDPIMVRSRLFATADTLMRQERVFTNSNGLVVWGTLGEHLGFLTDVRDSQEWGTRHYPYVSNYTQEGLGFVRSSGDQIDHDETISHLAYNWNYLTLQYGKDKNRWGPGQRGQLAISDRATSYDEIKLQICGDNFKFTSLWAVLQHYDTQFFTGGHKEKYLAAHRLELAPWKFLGIGFYEMVLYAGRQFEPSYFNPLMFFRSAEHYLGDRDNAAMGLDVELKLVPKTKLYGELFIDDITTSKLGTGFYGNKYALLAGLSHVDLLGMDNLDFRSEYAYIRPFTYTHGDITNFQHYNTNLGHPLGPNAEELFVGLKYQYSQPFRMESFVAWQRHGANTAQRNYGGSLYDAWEYGDREDFPFLDGIQQQTMTLSLLCSYEFLRNAFIQLQYTHQKAKTDWPGISKDFPGKRNSFILRFSLNE